MNRALSSTERRVLEAVVTHGVGGEDDPVPSPVNRARWKSVISDLTVSGTCDCGLCPSIELAYRGRSVEEKENSRFVLYADIYNQPAFVLLLIEGDIPSYLEIVPLDDEQVVVMPDPGELIFVER